MVKPMCLVLYVDFSDFSKEILVEKLKKDGCNPKSLSKPVEFPHVTLLVEEADHVKYKGLYGESAIINVIGYGNDGNNEALLVSVDTPNKLINDMLENINKPYITLSTSKDGVSANSKDLDYTPITPFQLVGFFGAFTSDGRRKCIAK